jgi:hypothetical protein
MQSGTAKDNKPFKKVQIIGHQCLLNSVKGGDVLSVVLQSAVG